MVDLSAWRVDDSRLGLTHNPVASQSGSTWDPYPCPCYILIVLCVWRMDDSRFGLTPNPVASYLSLDNLTFLLSARFVVAWARQRELSFHTSTVCGEFCRLLERRNLRPGKDHRTSGL